MMNSGSGNVDQVAVGVVDELDIDFESWINELRSDDCLEFDVMFSVDPTTSNLDYSSQPITSTINAGTSLISGSENQSQGGMNQEISSMTPSNSTATLQISGPVLYAAPSLVSNHLAQNCQSMRTTDYPQYHSVQPTPANQNLLLRQEQVHSQAHQYSNFKNTQLYSQADHQYNNNQLHSRAHQSNILFGQKNNHVNHQRIWDQLHTYTRPTVDSQMGNVRNQQALRQLHNVNWKPNNKHLHVQQNTWTAHDLITGGVKHGNNPCTNLSASAGFLTPAQFPSSDAWREYAFRQIRKMKDSYSNDLLKMHNNATYSFSKATTLQESNEYQKAQTCLAKMIGFLCISNIDLIPKHDESVYNNMTLIVNYVHHFRSKNSVTCDKHAQFNWSPVPSQQVSGPESNMVIRKRKTYSRRPVEHYGRMPCLDTDISSRTGGRMPCLDIDISSTTGVQKKSENPLQINGSLKAPSSSVKSTSQQINLEKLKQPMQKTNERRKCTVRHGMSPLGSGLLDHCPSPQSLPSTVKQITRKTASQSVVNSMEIIPDNELDNLFGPYEDDGLSFMQETKNESTHTIKWDLDQFLSCDLDIFHAQTSTNKRLKIENNYGKIMDEIKQINSKLVETSLDVVSDTFIDTLSKTGVNSGTIVKCSYKNVCTPEVNSSPGVVYSDKTEFFVQLLVPAEYPASPPRIFKSGFDVLSVPLKKPYEEMLYKFDLSLHELPKQNSLGYMARKWDSCVRGVLLEFVHKNVKGLSSRYGNWKNSSSGSS